MLAAALALFTAATAAGCSTAQPTATGKPVVVTSLYALQFAAEAVAGDAADVVNLTPSGVEPHDLELSVQKVQHMHDADLLVYIAGFAQAVDDAVAGSQGRKVEALDVVQSDANAVKGDPHFWLNPLLVAKTAHAIARQLSEIDPAKAATYQANAKRFGARMSALDEQWSRGTKTCASRDFVSSHASFAYLAKRYNLTAHAVLGLNPDAEPTPSAIGNAIDMIRAKRLTTVYSERLLNSKIANTIAKETGVKVRVLDPMEGNTDGLGYEAIMRSNLASFVAGNGCRA